jgi:dephospho-CoA kinase
VSPDPNPRKPLVIGLLGGVSSGKSTVARIFEEAGFRRIDADAAARRATEDPEILARIRERFGTAIIDRDGALDRDAMAAVVFDDERARRDLERIVHPAVRAAITAELDDALGAGKSVVLDVPLLIEGGLIDRCGWAVFVEASGEVRAQRAAKRGWSDDEVRRREAAQLPLAVKKARAAASIDNSGTLEQTRAQVEAFLARVLSSEPDRGP